MAMETDFISYHFQKKKNLIFILRIKSLSYPDPVTHVLVYIFLIF